MQSIKRAIEPYQRQKAEERQLNANPSGKKLDPSVNLIQGDRTLDKVAGFVGDSRNTLSKAEKIVEAAEQTIRGVKSIDNWFSDHTNNKTEWDEFSHKSFMGKRDPRTSPLRYDEQFIQICKDIGYSPKYQYQPLLANR